MVHHKPQAWWVSIQSIVGIVRGRNWSLGGALWYRSVVMLSECRHPWFRNLNPTNPVDIVRVKSSVDSLLNSTRVHVPVRVSVNTLNFVPEWIMPGLIFACSEMAEVWVRESYISLSCSLIHSCLHLPVAPTYTLLHSQGILYTTPSCFRGSTGSLGCTKCDLSIVLDLKTDRTPCCCRQWWSGPDTPLMYGRTAVDLISVAGSLSEACRFLDFVMLVIKE